MVKKPIEEEMPVDEEIEVVEGEGGEGADFEETDDMPESEAEGGERTPNVSPEEQEEYETFVNNGLHIIYHDNQVDEVVLENLKGSNPTRALATTASSIVIGLLDKMQEQNVPMNADVILHGGGELTQDLADLAAEAKIHKYSEKEVGDAFTLAVARVTDHMKQAGMLDPAAFQQDINELKAAQEAGRLDEVLPGMGALEERMQRVDAAQGEKPQTTGLLEEGEDDNG